MLIFEGRRQKLKSFSTVYLPYWLRIVTVVFIFLLPFRETRLTFNDVVSNSLTYWYRCYGYRLQVMYCFVLFYKRLTVVAVSDKPKSSKNKRYFYSDGVKHFLSVIFHELLLYAFYTDRRSLLIHNIWPIKSLFLF